MWDNDDHIPGNEEYDQLSHLPLRSEPSKKIRKAGRRLGRQEGKQEVCTPVMAFSDGGLAGRKVFTIWGW